MPSYGKTFYNIWHRRLVYTQPHRYLGPTSLWSRIEFFWIPIEGKARTLVAAQPQDGYLPPLPY
jgi:hypothetical protein